MTKSAESFWRQAESFRKISDAAGRYAASRYGFNPKAWALWCDISRAASRCRSERVERARALETV